MSANHRTPAFLARSHGPRLHTELFGPDSVDAPTVLAVHGLTGHGRRWESLASRHLADVRVVAPDLVGHGRSPWQPPWTIEAQVGALSRVLDEHARTPVVVLGHSFGGALAMHLAAARPEAVTALVLLDPAQGLDPQVALESATDGLAHPDYPDVEAVREAKRAEGWASIPEALESDIADHLVDLPSGRVAWRVATPAVATIWSEMARPAVLPPHDVPAEVVVADRVDPPFVGPEFLQACATGRAATVRVHHVDCGHMVWFEMPSFTADLVRAHL